MAFTHRRTVRFDDVDFARFVYFPRFFAWSHDTFEDFFAQEVKLPYAEMVVEKKVGWPLVRSEADFKSPLRFGDPVRIEMAFERIGNRSVTVRHQIYRGEAAEPSAIVTLTHACIDIEKLGAVQIPRELEEHFRKHLTHEATRAP